MSSDWLERPRQGKLDRGLLWMRVLAEEYKDEKAQMTPLWKLIGIPQERFQAFGMKVARAQAALQAARDTRGNKVLDEECRVSFEDLEKDERDLKDRFMKVPPLTSAQRAALDLKEKDKSNPVYAPTNQCDATVEYAGPGLLRLRFRALAGIPSDPRANYGFRFYWGLMPPGGATVEQATGKRRYLMKVPVSGEELPWNDTTRRRNELLDKQFLPEESGMRVYFCVRYVNAKGETGPWGPIFSAILP